MGLIADVAWETRMRRRGEVELLERWRVWLNEYIRPELPEDAKVRQIKLLDEGGQHLSVRWVRPVQRSDGEWEFSPINYTSIKLPSWVRFPVELLDVECMTTAWAAAGRSA